MRGGTPAVALPFSASLYDASGRVLGWQFTIDDDTTPTTFQPVVSLSSVAAIQGELP